MTEDLDILFDAGIAEILEKQVNDAINEFLTENTDLTETMSGVQLLNFVNEKLQDGSINIKWK